MLLRGRGLRLLTPRLTAGRRVEEHRTKLLYLDHRPSLTLPKLPAARAVEPVVRRHPPFTLIRPIQQPSEWRRCASFECARTEHRPPGTGTSESDRPRASEPGTPATRRKARQKGISALPPLGPSRLPKRSPVFRPGNRRIYPAAEVCSRSQSLNRTPLEEELPRIGHGELPSIRAYACGA